MSKSQRRVSRKFGGVLCGTCVKEVEKYKTRMECGIDVKRDLTIEKFLPAGWRNSLKGEKVEKAPAKTKAKASKPAAKKTKKPSKKKE